MYTCILSFKHAKSLIYNESYAFSINSFNHLLIFTNFISSIIKLNATYLLCAISLQFVSINPRDFRRSHAFSRPFSLARACSKCNKHRKFGSPCYFLLFQLKREILLMSKLVQDYYTYFDTY